MLASRSDFDKKDQLNKSLCQHADTGALKDIQSCLDQGADIDHHEGCHAGTPISRAARRGHTAIVSCLLSAGANFSLGITQDHMKIFRIVSPELAKRLIENLAAHTDFDNYQMILSHVESIHRYLENKDHGNRLVKKYKNLLLEQVTNAEKKSFAFAKKLRIEIDHILNQRFLAYAATNNYEAMKVIARESGVYLDYKTEVDMSANSPKFTALYWAIYHEHLEMVEWLVNESTSFSRAALFTVDAFWQAERINQVIADKILDVIAANTNPYNFDETLRRLGDYDKDDLKKSVTQNYLSKLVLLPTSKLFRDRIDRAQKKHIHDTLAFEFLCSVRDRDLAGAKKYLESGADVDCRLFGMRHNISSGIDSAVANEQFEMVELLLLYKVKTTGALKLAIEKSNLAIAKLLLDHNASPTTKVYDDHQEISLLSFALKRSSEELIKLLLKAMARQTNSDNYHTTLSDIEKSDHPEAHFFMMYFLSALIAFHQNIKAEESSMIHHAKITLWTKLLKTALDSIDHNDFEKFNDCVSLEAKIFNLSSPDDKLYAQGIKHCVETGDSDKFTYLLKLGTSKVVIPAMFNIIQGMALNDNLNKLVSFFAMLEMQQEVMLNPEHCLAMSHCIEVNISPKNRKTLKVKMTELLSTTEHRAALDICEKVLVDSNTSIMAKIFRIKHSESSRECHVSRGSLKDINTLATRLRKLVPLANHGMANSGNANSAREVAVAVVAPPIASPNETEDAPRSPHNRLFKLFDTQTATRQPQPSANNAIEMRDLGNNLCGSESRENSPRGH